MGSQSDCHTLSARISPELKAALLLGDPNLAGCFRALAQELNRLEPVGRACRHRSRLLSNGSMF